MVRETSRGKVNTRDLRSEVNEVSLVKTLSGREHSNDEKRWSLTRLQ